MTFLPTITCLLLISSIQCYSAAPQHGEQSELSSLKQLLNKYNLQQNPSDEPSSDSPSNDQLWEQLAENMPGVKKYLDQLDDCVNVVNKLNIIQKYFYYIEGDEEGIAISQITLCQLGLTLGDVFQTENNQQTSASTLESILGEFSNNNYNKEQVYNNVEEKPIETKRAYDSIGTAPVGFKRAYDSIGTAPIGFKRAYDSIGTAPIGFKRAYDSIGTAPIGFKRAYDSIGTAPVGFKRSYEGVEEQPVGPLNGEDKQSATLKTELGREGSRVAKEILIKEIEAELRGGSESRSEK